MSQIANAKISVIREHDYSSEPGFVLSSFSGRETMTLSKGFPGPILIPWFLWIVLDLQTLNGIDVTVKQFLSQRTGWKNITKCSLRRNRRSKFSLVKGERI